MFNFSLLYYSNVGGVGSEPVVKGAKCSIAMPVNACLRFDLRS